MKEFTFEAVNQEIENLNLDQLESNLNTNNERGVRDISSKICLLWKSLGSVIRLISKIPLIPRKWRKALELFITTMDSICG